VSASSRGDFIIDPYESGPFTVADTTADGTGVSTTQSNLTDVLGGKRTITVQLRQTGMATASLATTAGKDALTMSATRTGSGGASTVIALAYDSDVANQFNANLAQGGNDRFRFTLTDGPVGGAVLLQVSAFSGGAATLSVPVNGPGVYDAPFSSFAPLAVPQFNFGDVDSIDAIFSMGNQANTISYGVSDLRVTSVPEPSGLLLGTGALGAVTLRSRRGRRARTRGGCP
jgi:hypothetical protein